VTEAAQVELRKRTSVSPLAEAEAPKRRTRSKKASGPAVQRTWGANVVRESGYAGKTRVPIAQQTGVGPGS